MSDSSDWTLQGHSIEGYRMLMQATVTCLSDPTLSDTALYDQAEQLLGVFDDPEFEAYNRPDWLAQSAIFYMRPDKRERFSAKHFFEAMYQTADEWKLDKGHRFVSAAVCACAELLSSNTTGPPADRLAQELSFLAFEIWFVDQFTHLNQTNPDYEAELSEDTKTKARSRLGIHDRCSADSICSPGSYARRLHMLHDGHG
ncbi:hypothetical protein OH76DRAFT_1407383 [Lentinus brumalis]|uniref:Uncharacterized protein n=1 Tax=Lentinus brumalis TaxID=2498619 RepID=A0A371D0K5_9APHY|nr:hypothetical protein OH76DRAFT_1407383 [Polyporus brumalis]